MPIYVYKCPKCDKLHEILIKMGDETPQKCDKCQQVMKKLVYGPRQFVFKGDGTYAKGKTSHGKLK